MTRARSSVICTENVGCLILRVMGIETRSATIIDSDIYAVLLMNVEERFGAVEFTAQRNRAFDPEVVGASGNRLFLCISEVSRYVDFASRRR